MKHKTKKLCHHNLGGVNSSKKRYGLFLIVEKKIGIKLLLAFSTKDLQDKNTRSLKKEKIKLSVS